MITLWKQQLGSHMQTKYNTDDLRICGIKEVIPPAQVHEEMPISNTAAETTLNREQVLITLNV